MATKSIKVCDWEHETDVQATYRNRWTNPEGKRRRNDLCESHQLDFLKMWERLEAGSVLDTVEQPAPKRSRQGLTESAIIRAWAKKEGLEVSNGGRIPFHIEQQWKQAGRPNILDQA